MTGYPIRSWTTRHLCRWPSKGQTSSSPREPRNTPLPSEADTGPSRRAAGAERSPGHPTFKSPPSIVFSHLFILVILFILSSLFVSQSCQALFRILGAHRERGRPRVPSTFNDLFSFRSSAGALPD